MLCLYLYITSFKLSNRHILKQKRYKHTNTFLCLMAPAKSNTLKTVYAALLIVLLVTITSIFSALGESTSSSAFVRTFHVFDLCMVYKVSCKLHEHAAETLCDPVDGKCDNQKCTNECREKATKQKNTLTRIACERHLKPQECCCTFDDINNGILTNDIGVDAAEDDDHAHNDPFLVSWALLEWTLMVRVISWMQSITMLHVTCPKYVQSNFNKHVHYLLVPLNVSSLNFIPSIMFRPYHQNIISGPAKICVFNEKYVKYLFTLTLISRHSLFQ